MTEKSPSAERAKVKFGPDKRFTFIGGEETAKQLELLTARPEIETRIASHGINPSTFSENQFIHLSGIPDRDRAIEEWREAIAPLTSYEIYEADPSVPSKGTVLTFMGYEVDKSAIKGTTEAGDSTRRWIEEGYMDMILWF